MAHTPAPRPISAEKAHVADVADEEGHHAAGEVGETAGNEEDVAGATEELRGNEQPRSPVVRMFLAHQVSQRRGGKERQQGGLHNGRQFMQADELPEEVQNGGDDKKGAGDAPQGRFTHGFNAFVPAS